jgi:hypothetical protein
VLKEAAEAELVEAIRRAAVGDSYLNPRLGLGSRPSRRRALPTVSPRARPRSFGWLRSVTPTPRYAELNGFLNYVGSNGSSSARAEVTSPRQYTNRPSQSSQYTSALVGMRIAPRVS